MSKNGGGGIFYRASEAFDIPAEVVAGAARIEITGNHRFVMENHRGVLEYSSEAVDILGNRMTVRLRGTGLEIRAMNENELLVTGSILDVEFVT